MNCGYEASDSWWSALGHLSNKGGEKKLTATAISYSDLISKFGENELKYPPKKKFALNWNRNACCHNQRKFELLLQIHGK